MVVYSTIKCKSILFSKISQNITTVCCSTKRSVELYIQLLYLIRTTNAILFFYLTLSGEYTLHARTSLILHSIYNLKFILTNGCC